MFEELPELETKDFIRKTCESIGWYWTHDSDADEILWFVEQIDSCFPALKKRLLIERTIYQLGVFGHQETHTIIIHMQQMEENITDHFLHFKATIHQEIPESKKNPAINFLWLYIEYVFSLVMKEYANKSN